MSLPPASLLLRSFCPPERESSPIIWFTGNAQNLCSDSGCTQFPYHSPSLWASLCLFIFPRLALNTKCICPPKFIGIVLRYWVALFKIPLSGFGFRRWYSHPSLPWRMRDTQYSSLQRKSLQICASWSFISLMWVTESYRVFEYLLCQLYKLEWVVSLYLSIKFHFIILLHLSNSYQCLA